MSMGFGIVVAMNIRKRNFPERAGRSALIVLTFCVLLISIHEVTADSSLEVGFEAKQGVVFIDSLYGTITLKAYASSDIVLMSVSIDGEDVYSVDGSTLTWQSNTEDFGEGIKNITVVGWDNVGHTIHVERIVEFMAAEEVENLILVTAGTVIIVLGLSIFVVLLLYRRRR